MAKVKRPLALEFTRYLDELVRVDAAMMTRLLRARIGCNDGIKERLSLFVWDIGEKPPGASVPIDTAKVSILGVLNGFFTPSKDGFGPIAFRIERATGDVVGVHLTRHFHGCSNCERALGDDEDLEICLSCSAFVCRECVKLDSGGDPLCPSCAPPLE